MNKMKSNILWNAGGNLTYLLCQWLVTVLVTKLGHFEDAGLLSVAMSVSATCQTLALFGIRNFQVSDVNEKYSDTCYTCFRLISCGASLAVCVLFSLVYRYRGEQLLAILLFMSFRLVESFADVLHGIAQKKDRLDVAGKSFAIKGVGLLIFFLLGYQTGGGSLNTGLFCMTAFSLASLAFYDLPVVRKLSDFGWAVKTKSWLRLALETLPLCAYMFMNTAMTTVPKLVLEKISGGEVLGAYASIFAPALLIQAAMGYIYNPFAQVLARHWVEKDRKKFFSLGLRIAGAILLLTALMLIAATLAGEWVLVTIFGEMIRPYIYLLPPILLAIAAVSFFAFLCMVAIVLRAFLWLLSACGVGLLFCITMSAPMIGWFSTSGASYAVLGAMLLASVVLCMGIFARTFPRANPRDAEPSNE